MGLTEIFVRGAGAVSPAGWGRKPLCETLEAGRVLPVTALERPGWTQPLRVRRVPPLPARPAALAHPRLRRASPVTQFAVAAAFEALDTDLAAVKAGLRVGIVFCVLVGCVNYSRRFYHETLRDPATASPLLFPETVFNAPASHLATLLGTDGPVYTLVGDDSNFLMGLAWAADLILSGQVEACLVVGAEEMDWLSAEASRLFDHEVILSEGAGALYLKPNDQSAAARLAAITDAHPYLKKQTKIDAARAMRAQLPPAQPDALLCSSAQGRPRTDAAELAVWRDWTGRRLAPKILLGEGLAASSAWQCVAAIDVLEKNHCSAASVSVVGLNQQAIGAHFVRTEPGHE